MPPYTMVQVTVHSPTQKGRDDAGGDTSVTTSSSSGVPSLASHAARENSNPGNTGILQETVRGIKDVASGSVAVLKEWAASPPGPNDPNGDKEDSWYKSLGRSASAEDRAAARKALQDLMSPFMACHGGSYEPRTKAEQRHQNASVHINNMSRDLDRFRDSVFVLEQNDSETVVSVDTAMEDEMMQLQRLTSWATDATNETHNTDLTAETTSSKTTTTENPQRLTDDDGHIIPQALLQSAQKRREKRQRRRKRVVRFDYPPISSLRECPRPDPDDLPDLFFTEEELDEIEADRVSAVAVDDIEIVAVASNKSVSSQKSSFDDISPKHSLSGDMMEKFGKQFGTPKLQRKPRLASPHPKRPAPGTFGRVQPDFDLPSPLSRKTPPTTPPSQDPRLIKGVQIYLRERSTGKGAR